MNKFTVQLGQSIYQSRQNVTVTNTSDIFFQNDDGIQYVKPIYHTQIYIPSEC